MNTVFILIGVMAVLMIIGVPISMAVGAATMAAVLPFDIPLAVVAQRMFTALDSTSTMAIPFFILAGNIMTQGGISRRLCELCNDICGNIRGGMAYAVIFACAFFAALSGSAPATVLAIGSIFYPEMKKLGYPEKRAAGLLTVSGGLGPIIPPSIIMVIYCTMTNTSVGDMFKAGVIWGGILIVMLCGITAFLAKKENWPKSNKKINVKSLFSSVIKALPAIFCPVIILGGIYSGIMTPTESAAVAVVYSFIVGMFVYRELKPSHVIPIFLDSAKSSALVLFIIASSTAFSWVFTFSGASTEVVNWVLGMNLSPILFAFLVCIILQIFGTFLEGIATAVLLVPIFWPIAQSLGIDPVYFGMIVSLSNVLGTMDPPVAVNIFAAASISKLKVGDIVRGEIPYYIGFMIVLYLCVFFPQISSLFL
ncbi:TRAP transporter large permease [Alloiococcus sp. CFN-8]|uniref:TRAP transporter large permease n=1 Tax=Alloiococcus sp. CFN-8 TaxID=3416081 RepID=UPI003CF9B5A3